MKSRSQAKQPESPVVEVHTYDEAVRDQVNSIHGMITWNIRSAEHFLKAATGGPSEEYAKGRLQFWVDLLNFVDLLAGTGTGTGSSS